jgi:hypothetical protein
MMRLHSTPKVLQVRSELLLHGLPLQTVLHFKLHRRANYFICRLHRTL